MAIVSLNKKEIKKIVGNISDDRIDEILSMFSTPIKRIDGKKIEVEIAPNRPDMLSEQGLIRALSCYLGKNKGLKKYKIKKPEKNFTVVIDNSLKDIRPFTACAIVKNLKFDEEKIKEIIDIQEKIHSTLGRNRKKIAIGIYPLEKITLPIKFEAKKPTDFKFVPLESNEEMNGLQILQKHPTGRDYAHLLEGNEKFPVFIDSAGEILSMPPIINSNKTGKIKEETKDVFIECSGFDFLTLKKALNILVIMLADMGGEIYSMNLKYKNRHCITPDLKPEKIKLNTNNVNKLLGLNLKENEIKKLLEKMGYDYKTGNVFIPAWRVDIIHEVDLVEDIAIAYGYQNFMPEIPLVATIGEEDKKEIIKRKIANILSGLKLLETSTYHLTTPDSFTKTNIKKSKNIIEVENSKTEYNLLRENLLSNSLKILSENIDVGYPQEIFEIGKVFINNGTGETTIEEKENLVVSLIPGGFTELKQILDYLFSMLNLKYEIEHTKHDSFIEGRTGKIIFSGKEIGIIGEIHPIVIKNFKLKMPLSSLEISLEEIFGALR